MHIDENKKFDRRSTDKGIREGSISEKEYKEHLASLPDVSDKVYVPEDKPLQKGAESQRKSRRGA